METYLNNVKTKLGNLAPHATVDNLTPEERRALNHLSKNKKITIKSADKGTAIVIEDSQTYMEEGLEHLADQTIYEEIDRDPTQGLKKSINRLAQDMLSKGFIDKDTKECLTLDNVRTQNIYFLKKLHKTPHALRPIVSGCGGPTENLSHFMDHFLKPLVVKKNSYLKDSMQLIRTLEETVLPEDIILMTIDVKALYTNIPHAEGIAITLTNLYRDNDNRDVIPFPLYRPEYTSNYSRTQLLSIRR